MASGTAAAGLRRLIARSAHSAHVGRIGAAGRSPMAVFGCRFATTPDTSSATSTTEQFPGSGASSEANSYINLGSFETVGQDQGRMAMGIAYLEEQCQVLEQAYDAEVDKRKKAAKAVGVAEARLQVGRQHHQQQDPNLAISHYKHALSLIQGSIKARESEEDKVSKKLVRYASFVMSEICSALGVAFNDVARKEEALQMHNAALSLRKAMVGKDHPSVAECMNNLGAVYFGKEAYQKSAEHYEQALELLSAASGGVEEGPYVALIYYNMGLCRGHLGQVQAAVAALRKGMKIAENALGTDHTTVELIRQTLAQATGGGPGGGPKPPSGEEPQMKSE